MFKYLICWRAGREFMAVESDDLDVLKYLAKTLSKNEGVSQVELIDRVKGGYIEFE